MINQEPYGLKHRHLSEDGVRGLLILLGEQEEIDLESLAYRAAHRGIYQPKKKRAARPHNREKRLSTKMQILLRLGFAKKSWTEVRYPQVRYAITDVGRQLLSEIR